jgi:hypothetical protein
MEAQRHAPPARGRRASRPISPDRPRLFRCGSPRDGRLIIINFKISMISSRLLLTAAALLAVASVSASEPYQLTKVELTALALKAPEKLRVPIATVVDKPQSSPSGDAHDYVSFAAIIGPIRRDPMACHLSATMVVTTRPKSRWATMNAFGTSRKTSRRSRSPGGSIMTAPPRSGPANGPAPGLSPPRLG